jgi:flagellin
LNTNVNSLNVALENVTSSESNIADADFAAETANLTRAQILTQAGTSVLATANSTPQQVLSLLPH